MPKKKVAERKKRIPFGGMRTKLNLDQATEDKFKSAGKTLRWINDEDHGMRLRAAEDGGYNFVDADDTEIGSIKELQDDKRRIRKLVGTHKDGSPKYAYLMAISKRIYNADQKKKEEQNELVDIAIKGGQPAGVGNHMDSDLAKTYPKNIQYKP